MRQNVFKRIGNKRIFLALKGRSVSGGRNRLYLIGGRIFRASLAGSLALSFLFFLCAPIVCPAEQSSIRLAPLNPRYLKYKAEKEAARITGATMVTSAPAGRKFGYIPSRINFSYLRQAAQNAASPKNSFPAQYDLRKKNKVPPVKNQSYCGSCWAFASIVSVETALMGKYTADFSEQAIIDMHGFDFGPCEGGEYSMSTAVMARQGVVSQNQYTYQYLDANDTVPQLPASAWVGAHIQDVDLIYVDSSPYTAGVKRAITTHGAAVAVAFYVDEGMASSTTSDNFNASTCAYYDPKEDSVNHGVAIIGWDDDFSPSNFSTTPPGKGAYLVRNSWGNEWGKSGYFWMSYYDASLQPQAFCFYGVEPATNYKCTYQYDPLGWTGSAGWSDDYGYGAHSAWMANVFRVDRQATNIEAVSFYAPDAGTSYTVQIYDNVAATGSLFNPSIDPVAGTLKLTVTGVSDTAGYHTVKFSRPVGVTAGALFSAVVGLSDPYSSYPIAVQQQDSDYSSNSTITPGKSFASPNGARGNWTDLATQDPSQGWKGYRVCLKAFGN